MKSLKIFGLTIVGVFCIYLAAYLTLVQPRYHKKPTPTSNTADNELRLYSEYRFVKSYIWPYQIFEPGKRAHFFLRPQDWPEVKVTITNGSGYDRPVVRRELPLTPGSVVPERYLEVPKAEQGESPKP